MFDISSTYQTIFNQRPGDLKARLAVEMIIGFPLLVSSIAFVLRPDSPGIRKAWVFVMGILALGLVVFQV